MTSDPSIEPTVRSLSAAQLQRRMLSIVELRHASKRIDSLATVLTLGPKLEMLVSVALWCCMTCRGVTKALPSVVWASSTSRTG